MKVLWIATAASALLWGLSVVNAQDRDDREQDRVSQSKTTKKESQSKDRKTDGSKTDNREGKDRSAQSDDEIRLKYDNEKNRLSVDVDEDIRFPASKPGSERKPPIARDGEFELRYDTDRHDLRISGEGTINAKRTVNAMARWWQSWWEEEKTARRDRQQGAESGARHFVREHDENDDGRLSRDELPSRHRAEFSGIDGNEDGYLSVNEVRRIGDEFVDRQASTATNWRSNSRPREQTWSEWWDSWTSSAGSEGSDLDRMTREGGREFIRRYDRNDDDVIMRSEMPDRMYDEFDRLDTNHDRRLTQNELANGAPRLEQGKASGGGTRSR